MQSLLPFMGCLLLLVTSSSRPLWGEEPQQDFSGKYSCKGQDVNGSEYKGTVEITKNGDSYNFKWVLASGQTFIGVGIQDEHTISVSWVSRGVAGVMLYKLQENGTLLGRWALINSKGTVQKEVLTPAG